MDAMAGYGAGVRIQGVVPVAGCALRETGRLGTDRVTSQGHWHWAPGLCLHGAGGLEGSSHTPDWPERVSVVWSVECGVWGLIQTTFSVYSSLSHSPTL